MRLSPHIQQVKQACHIMMAFTWDLDLITSQNFIHHGGRVHCDLPMCYKGTRLSYSYLLPSVLIWLPLWLTLEPVPPSPLTWPWSVQNIEIKGIASCLQIKVMYRILITITLGHLKHWCLYVLDCTACFSCPRQLGSTTDLSNDSFQSISDKAYQGILTTVI